MRDSEGKDAPPIDAGYYILWISHAMRHTFNHFFEGQGITFPQSRVMDFLFKNPDKESINQRDLERALGIKASSISSLVHNLESKGLIMGERTERDARNKNITLTGKGHEMRHALDAALNDMRGSMMQGFDRQDSDELVRLLIRVKENLEA